jgi:DNA-binding IclR family transcriptional regulator
VTGPILPVAQSAVPGLERGLNLLRLFKRSRPAISPPEMARELGIPRSTVHRLLTTLEAMGFLRRVDGGGAYALGPAVLGIGFEYLGSLDIVQLANPVLARLSEETGGSTHLAIRSGADVVYLARHATSAAITSNVAVGTSLPAHGTVIGRMTLLDLSAAELQALYGGKRLPRYSDQTPTSLGALETLLAEDRRRGYGVSNSFYERGIASVAAPVRDRSGRVAAAINATLIDAELDERMLHGTIKDRVCAAAAAISAMLGAPQAAPDVAPRRRQLVGT